PGAKTLETAYRRAFEVALLNQQINEAAETAHEEAQRAAIPKLKTLEHQIRKQLKETPERSWDAVVAELATRQVSRKASCIPFLNLPQKARRSSGIRARQSTHKGTRSRP